MLAGEEAGRGRAADGSENSRKNVKNRLWQNIRCAIIPINRCIGNIDMPVPTEKGGNPMSKRTLVLILSIVASLALVATGTLAYLTDSDADVNVMTLGNVDILQNEQERTQDGTLDEFTQNKPAYPAVGTIAWADEKITFGDSEFKVFADDLKNVVDKFVTVTNTGKSDAYIRTIVAIEAPDYDAKNLIHINANNTNGITQTTGWTPVDIDGVQYVYSVFTYNDALPAGETSLPSLLQLFLGKETTNEDVARFGDTWEVKVLSQAVQAQGFSDAPSALDEAFGEATADHVEDWLGNATIGSPGDEWGTNNPPEADAVKVNTFADLQAAAADGGTIWQPQAQVMTDADEKLQPYPGYNLPAAVFISKDTDLYLEGITYNGGGSLSSVMAITKPDADAGTAGPVVNIYADNDAVFSSNDPEGTNIIAANRGSIVNVYGGTYVSAQPAIIDLNGNTKYGRKTQVNIYDGFFYTTDFSNNTLGLEENMLKNREMINITSNSYSEINVYGGTFVNFNPGNCYDGDYVPDGYKVVEELQANGDMWFTVVPE